MIFFVPSPVCNKWHTGKTTASWEDSGDVMTFLRVGLIGFGSIGSAVAGRLRLGEAGPCTLAAVLVRGHSLGTANRVRSGDCVVTANPDEFFGQSLDVVVEGAGQVALRQYGARALESGADLVVTSTGALSDDSFRGELIRLAGTHGRRVLVSSGAIAGLDGISAAAMGRVEEALHITRKPPVAWKGTIAEQQHDLDHLTVPVVLYEGSPRESAQLFPANVNVQTAVALAGVGLDRTRVKVVADPTVEHNVHEVLLRGEFGELRIELKNVPSPENPKTGRLTALAVIKTLRNLTAPLVVGA